MARYRTRYKKRYNYKPRRRPRRRKSGMAIKKAHKDMLKGAGIGSAILVFVPDTYRRLKEFVDSFKGVSS